jgi:hypothetical protein
MKREVWIPLVAGLFLLGIVIPNEICQHAWQRYRIALTECPDGEVRQTAELAVRGVRRGGEGTVTFTALAHYTIEHADAVQTERITRVRELSLRLVGPQQATPLAVEWGRAGGSRTATLVLPDVPDGDYKLVAEYETGLGKGEVEVALPLYSPARVHVITDRPLYEPGNTVQFRAVVLRARDLGPLDGRPGRWVVTDPSGEIMLDEKAGAGDWGVVAGTFPLDPGASTGQWRVAWVSHEARDEVAFTVEPFTLPRFRVEASADRPHYGVGASPIVKGAVLYSSGAPVAGAKLDIQWHVAGSWPPPTDWLASKLPKQAIAKPNGRFELALPEIPDDLQGKATLIARISAIDPAGDRVEGTAAVLLSKDGIEASAVTELGDGLVESFNNRLYIRVATPDGRVVPKVKIRVRRTWQPNDNGIEAELDEDGVASLQIDPGAPVNIVIPALPYRPAPRPALVARGEIEDLIGGEGASLADQIEVDRWLPGLATCAKYAGDETSAEIGLRVAASGAILTAGGGPSALDQCVIAALRGKRLPAGTERLFTIDFELTDPELPRLGHTIETAIGEAPDELERHVAVVAAAARDCLPRADGDLPSLLTWRVRAGSKELELAGWSRDPRVETADLQPAMPCVTNRLAAAGRVKLAAESPTDRLGVVRFAVTTPSGHGADARPQPTTMLGYELDVIAEIEGRPSTKLRITPGHVPDLRMRVSPIVVPAGGTVTAQLIRGPEFTGKLPEHVAIQCLRWKQDELPLDAERQARVTIDPSVEGWCELRSGGVRGLVYVEPKGQLAVTVQPRQPQYRPGQRAELIVQTTIAGQGAPAAVGLFGVDESLAQLVPLPGPDDMGRVRPQVASSSPAFGVLDGQALALGRIRGANAAAATVLRVTSIPSAPELDAVVDARGASRFDAIEELTDHFYIVLAELHRQARAWEARAPAAEKVQPATMARLWDQALEACRARGEPVTDAYGRTLRLWRLPPDLLSLTDPRAVIVVGTRLPEDVENWAQWVARERP